MNRKVYLSTYLITLYDKKDKNLFFSKYLPEKDFLQTFYDFIFDLGTDPHTSINLKKGYKKTLKIAADKEQHISEDNREIYGFLSSGLSGERAIINDTESGNDVFKMNRNHAKMVNTYYQVRIPENRRFAYLILQRQGTFGIKKLLEEAFHKYLIKINQKVNLKVNNFLISRIFKRMLEEGRIFEMSLIKDHVEGHIEELYDKGAKRVAGRTKTVICTERGLPLPVKSLAYNLYMRAQKDGPVVVEQLYDQFDEIDFEIEYNGSKKTIHMSNVGRSLPDYDVTDELIIDTDTDEPTLASLKAQADILIKDMEDYQEEKIRIK